MSSTTPANLRATYARYPGLWERYHGNFPIGMMVAYATEESGGRMICPGDDPNGQISCGGGSVGGGEWGIFQLTRATEPRFGAPDGFRKTTEGNFWLAGAEENTEAALAAKRYGVVPGSKDSWLFSFLTFAIGSGGIDKVRAAARAAGYGDSYDELIRWANNTGAIAVKGGSGTMPASTIARRINIAASNWNAGEAAGLPMDTGTPFIPTPPAGLHGGVPSEAAGLIGVGDPGTSAWLLAAGAVALYWYTRS